MYVDIMMVQNFFFSSGYGSRSIITKFVWDPGHIFGNLTTYIKKFNFTGGRGGEGGVPDRLYPYQPNSR